MASVTFRNGLTVDDSASPTTGLSGGGHRVRFVPSLSATIATALEAKNWASLLGGIVFDNEYSAKEYAVGDLTVTGGSAKAWAIDPDNVTVNGVDYSARAHAIGTVIPSGSAKDWAAGTRTIGGLQSARIYAEGAASSALTALNAPGTSATSTSSQTLPTAGSTYPFTLTYTIQTGKTLVVGAFVVAASTSSPANYAIGQVTSYNSTTGLLTISVASFAQVGGSGTFSTWAISLTALANVAGAMTLAGPNTNTGQNTFTNATAPIITPTVGPTSAQQHSLPSVSSDVFTLNSATQTLVNKTLTSPTINTPTISGGSINNATLGATTRQTARVTTLDASGNVILGTDTTNTHTVNGGITVTQGIAATNAVTGAGGSTAQATETLRGTLEVATAAEVSGGTDDLAAVTSKKLRENGRLQRFYESPQQTITTGGALTLAHGLGIKPTLYQTVIVNVTAEAGYTAGQELVFGTYYDDGASIRGAGIIPDATNLAIRYSSATNVFVAPNAGTGVRTALNNANWRAVFRAWG